jgi:hypothetical protein
MHDDPTGSGQNVVAYYFPIEIEVRGVPVPVAIPSPPATAHEDVRQLIDDAFREFAAGLEHA